MTIQRVRKRDLSITIGDNFVPFRCIIWKIVDSIFHVPPVTNVSAVKVRTIAARVLVVLFIHTQFNVMCIFDLSNLVLFVNADLFNVIIEYIKAGIVIHLTIILELLQSVITI